MIKVKRKALLIGITILTNLPINTLADSSDVATTKTNGSTQIALEQDDPYESYNRVIFSFNEKLDEYLLKPVAKFYNVMVPKSLNQGIHNFFNNIGELPIIANDMLQLRFQQTLNDIWRFGVNTTIGIGGLFDVATRINLKHYKNDFGLTLAYWGYKHSHYLVLPFWGSYTFRDAMSLPVDYFIFSIYPHIHPAKTRYGLYSLGVVDKRAQALQFETVIEEAAVDRYAFVRNAYLQRRSYEIQHQDGIMSYENEKPVAIAGGSS